MAKVLEVNEALRRRHSANAAHEASATTDANGAYTLDVDPADVGNYPIVAMAVKVCVGPSDSFDFSLRMP
ncbi:MAG TPA: hypothetical protein DDY22_15735 [Geobacter sp.]|nr:hypothetical protein [Geobacter sp.]